MDFGIPTEVRDLESGLADAGRGGVAGCSRPPVFIQRDAGADAGSRRALRTSGAHRLHCGPSLWARTWCSR